MRAPRILALLTGFAAVVGAAALSSLSQGEVAAQQPEGVEQTPHPSRLALLGAPPSLEEGGKSAPLRVVSTNVCTDQLALLLARPGQLVSVSMLAADPRLSALHDRAAGLSTNTGRAEEVFLLHPDLVVAADYSLHALTRFLRDAGYRAEEFAFAATLDGIAGDLRRMGGLLGAEAEAEQLAGATEARLEALRRTACAARPTALVRGQNGVVQGAGTLTDSVLAAAGFDNMAAALGYQGMTPFPLELLLARPPDLLILAEPWSGASASLADAAIDHPALAPLRRLDTRAFAAPGALTCAGPFTLDAAEALARWREANLPCPKGAGS